MGWRDEPARTNWRESERRSETASMHNSPSASSRADSGGHINVRSAMQATRHHPALKTSRPLTMGI
jgi:hypothetical protein